MSVIAKLNFTRPSPFLTVILDPFTRILYIFVHKITKVTGMNTNTVIQIYMAV